LSVELECRKNKFGKYFYRFQYLLKKLSAEKAQLNMRLGGKI
jgi:hypothetical protein